MDTRRHLTSFSASELAQAMADGSFGALDVVEAHIARLEAVDAQLHGLVARRYDAARQEARAVDARRARGEPLGPLAGVPITVKDSIDVAGLPSTFGLPWRKDLIATEDDPHVARLRAAGAIVLGKTNVAQLLFYLESDNPLHGRTLNPWNAERTCGGSSGGEAALIAAQASPLGIGSDIGGSLRNPAHFCGIASLKPTTGRCPDPGRFSVPAGQLAVRSQLGPMARHVADLDLALRTMAAPAADSGLAPLPPMAGVDVRRLRIGWYDDDPMFPAAPALRRAVREAAQALSDAGAQVQRFSPPPLAEGFGLAFSLMAGDGGRLAREMLRGGPVHPSLGFLLMLAGRSRFTLRLLQGLFGALGQATASHALALMGHTHVGEHWRRVQQLDDWRARFAAALDQAERGRLDLVLCPPCALPALRHGSTRDLGLIGPHTLVFNALGWPAGVLPWTTVRAGEESDRPASRDRTMQLARECERDSAGLPVGVQLAGRPWHEHQVLAAMAALEASPRRTAPGVPPLA